MLAGAVLRGLGALADRAPRLGRRRAGRLSRDFAREYPDIWERLIRPFARQAGLTGPYDLVQELLAAWRVIERRPPTSRSCAGS